MDAATRARFQIPDDAIEPAALTCSRPHENVSKFWCGWVAYVGTDPGTGHAGGPYVVRVRYGRIGTDGQHQQCETAGPAWASPGWGMGGIINARRDLESRVKAKRAKGYIQDGAATYTYSIQLLPPTPIPTQAEVEFKGVAQAMRDIGLAASRGIVSAEEVRKALRDLTTRIPTAPVQQADRFIDLDDEEDSDGW